MQPAINYLSAGNRYAESSSLFESDFQRFSKDGIKYIALRVFWVAFEPSYNPTQCVLDAAVVGNYIRVLDLAQKYGIRVNMSFWSYFQDVHWDMPSFITSIFNILSTDKPKWLRYVQTVINTFKNHPAVESWAIMGEPFYNTADQKAPMEQLITDTVNIARATDPNHKIVCRFTLSYTPASGRFTTAMYDLFDTFCVTEYLDPSNPSASRYNSTWTTWNMLISDLSSRNKKLWVLEFGNDSPSAEVNRVYYKGSLAKFATVSFLERAYAWDWQGNIPGGSDAFNIVSGATPLPAYEELVAAVSVTPPPQTSNILPVAILALIALGLLL